MPATAPPARGQEDTKELLLMLLCLHGASSDLPSPSLLSCGKTAGPPAFPFCLSLITDTKAHLEKGLQKPSLAEHHARL